MTPLFAPRPQPAGVGFGPGYGERQRGWSTGWAVPPEARSAQGYAPSDPKPDPRAAPAWPPARPAWPAAIGWSPPPAQGGFGTLPGHAPYGWGFGGFDPWTQQQVRQGGQFWPGPGGMFR